MYSDNFPSILSLQIQLTKIRIEKLTLFFWYGCWIWMTSVYVVCSNFICTNIKGTSSTMSMTILPGLKIIQIDKVLVIWDIDALLNDLEGLI